MTQFSTLDKRLSLFLVALLLGLYLLVYINAPDSADGKAMLAVASAIVKNGRPDMNAVGAGEWLFPPASQLGTFGVDGTLYTKKGPTPSIALLPFVAIADVLPWLSVRATAMLFNPIVTALTALALYAFLRWLNYSPRTALTTSLIFGIATLAIVYVKTLFGEPLVGLLVLVAMMSAYRYRQNPKRRDLLITASALALAVGVNTIYVVFIPVVALYLFWKPSFTRRALIDYLAFLAPLMVMALLLGLYNWMRFGSPLNSGYHFAQGEGFIFPLGTGLYAMLLSPYRGFFWYNPVLLLAIPAWLMFRRSTPRLAWIVLALIALQAISFATWWSWHGGIVWGPRFMLPVIPITVLLLAPLVEAAWSRLPLLLTLIGFCALSFGIQLLGVLYNYIPYIGWLFTHYPADSQFHLAGPVSDEVVYNPALSPIIGHLALLKIGWPLDPAWLANGVDGAHLIASFALIIVGFVILIRHRFITTRRAAFAVVLCAILSLNVIVMRQQNSPQEQQIQALNDALQPPGAVVAASLLFDDALLDLKNTSSVITMNAPTTPSDQRAAQIWNYALHQNHRLWFVTWFGPAATDNWQERQLWQTASFVVEKPLGQYRALWFELGSPPEPIYPGGWRFGNIQLKGYGVQAADGGLYVTLQWQADQPVNANIGWFVHLLDANGNIMAQQDRQPQGGYAPTTSWTPGTPITDRLFFSVSGIDTQHGRLRIGFIDPATGQRVPCYDPSGQPIPDGFILLPLTN